MIYDFSVKNWRKLSIDSFHFTREMSIEMACFKYDNWWFHEKICKKKLEGKIRENDGVLHFLAFDNFGFTKNIVEIFLSEKDRENGGFALFN